jgi:hypothetical protein
MLYGAAWRTALLLVGVGQAMAQGPRVTYTSSSSFTRAEHVVPISCSEQVTHRTRVIARMEGGPVVYDESIAGGYWLEGVDRAVVRAGAALEAAAAPAGIIISNARRTEASTEEVSTSEGKHVSETRTIGLTRRETIGPATLTAGAFASETNPCQGYRGGIPRRDGNPTGYHGFDAHFTTPVSPYGCPISGSSYAVPAGTFNIDTLTHIHTDIYKPTLTRRLTTTTYTYELTAVVVPEKSAPKADDAIISVGRVVNLLQKDSTFQVMNTSPTQAICVNLYTLSADDELTQCCSCRVKPTESVTLSALHDGFVYPTAPSFSELTVKLHATVAADGTCRDSARIDGKASKQFNAWGTTLQSSSGSNPNETRLSRAVMSSDELKRLTARCAVLQANASVQHWGSCRSCPLGSVDGGRLNEHPYCSELP